MAVTVRLPAMLQAAAGAAEMRIDEPVTTVDELLVALERQVPGLGARLDDPVYNLAVNGEMLLHGVRRHPIRAGDLVEIIPTISGGGGR